MDQLHNIQQLAQIESTGATFLGIVLLQCKKLRYHGSI